MIIYHIKNYKSVNFTIVSLKHCNHFLWILWSKWYCYTSQLTSFLLIGGESITCHWSKLHDTLGRTKLHDALGQQQLQLSTHMWSGSALLNRRGKFLCQPRQTNIFYAVVAAKRFQTRTEEETEPLLHDKSSKSTNKAHNAMRTLSVDLQCSPRRSSCFLTVSLGAMQSFSA